MKKKKGFTLIEVIIVIGLIGLLMLLVVPNLTKTFEESRKKTFTTQAQKLLKEVKSELAEYMADGMPSSSAITVCDTKTCDNPYSDAVVLNLKNKDVKYYAYISNRKIIELGIEDNGYCYYESGVDYSSGDISLNSIEDIKKIKDEYIVKGGTLDCSTGACTCGGAGSNTITELTDGYYYFGKKTRAIDVTLNLNITPNAEQISYMKKSYLSFARAMQPFVRVTISGGKATKYETCMSLDGLLFCLPYNYYETDKQTTENKLRNDIQNKLGVGITCPDGYPDEAYCYFERVIGSYGGYNDYEVYDFYLSPSSSTINGNDGCGEAFTVSPAGFTAHGYSVC